jgi:hypothetical protein
MARVLLMLMVLAECAAPPPPGVVPVGRRTVPAKCTACHLAPREHSLASARWERFQQNHRRRVRLAPEEREFLFDFLVGDQRPTGNALGGR